MENSAAADLAHYNKKKSSSKHISGMTLFSSNSLFRVVIVVYLS